MDKLIASSNEFFQKKFNNLNSQNQEIVDKVFESCTFNNCKLDCLKSCRFVECEFVNCDLSNAKIRYCSFNEVFFEECKLIGINWTEAKWPIINLGSPFKFFKSNLSHASFFELELTELGLEACSAKQVDFRGCNLAHSSFVETDFEGAIFQESNLEHCDFTDAINYHIDPTQNKINKAKFTLPDAMNLLLPFDIEIL